MQILSPPPLKSGPILMEDAHSAESTEIFFFRFLFVEVWFLDLQFTGDTSGFSSVSPTKKMTVQKW